jgi:hypothetical protein
MKGYPVERVQREVALLGRHVHWTLTEVLSLDHAERRRWMEEVIRQLEGETTAQAPALRFHEGGGS